MVAGTLSRPAIHKIDVMTVSLFLLQGKARECANEVRLQAHEVETVLANPPPMLQLDQASVAQAKWINKRWLIAHSKGNPCGLTITQMLVPDCAPPSSPLSCPSPNPLAHTPVICIASMRLEPPLSLSQIRASHFGHLAVLLSNGWNCQHVKSCVWT